MIIKPQFSTSHDFSQGLALMQSAQTEQWGYVNTLGEVVVPPKFQFASDFHEGSPLCRSTARWATSILVSVGDQPDLH